MPGSETIPFVYGHRYAASSAALALKLQPGEIGLVTTDRTVWMMDYDENFFQIGFGDAAAGGITGSLTANKIPYATGPAALANTTLTVDPATGIITAVNNFKVGSNINFDTSGLVESLFLDVNSSANIDGSLTLGGNVNVNSGKFTIDAGNGNTVIGGTGRIKEQATFDKSTVKGLKELTVVSGEIDINAYDSDDFEFVLNGNVLVNEPSNPATGRKIHLRIRTISTASVLTWDSIFIFLDGAPDLVAEVGYYYGTFEYNEHSNKWNNVNPFVGPF